MDILEVLKDDKEYYNGVGKEFLSNSDIGILLSNPKDYGKTRSDNKNFAGGRYFHQLLIEPNKAEEFPFVDVSTRTTKAYKEFCEENNLEFAMLKKEQDEIKDLVSTMRRNIQFYDAIYADGNQYEVPAVGEIQGMMWKGKADIVGNVIIDLKTTSDIQKFRWSASAYNYDSQCYIYQELFGKPLVFYVIDKETGQLGIFNPSEEFVMRGRDKVARAIEVFKKYFGPNPTDDIDNHCIIEVL
jgi:hypothetical protein